MKIRKYLALIIMKKTCLKNAWYIAKYIAKEKCIDLNMYMINYNQLSKHTYQEVRIRT